MKNQKNRIIAYCICFICYVISFVSLTQLSNQLEQEYRTLGIRNQEQALTVDQIEKLESTNQSKKIQISAWQCMEQVSIRSSLKQLSDTTVYKVSGNMKKLLNNSMVSGVIPENNDKNACVIRENTAVNLFGTNKVLGNTIEYNKKFYTIRGVTKSDEMLYIFGDSKDTYSNLEIYSAKEELTKTEVEQLFLTAGVDLQENIVDGQKHGVIIAFVTHFILMIFMLSIAIGILRIFLHQEKRKVKWSGIVITLGFSIACILVARINLSIPTQWLPARWGDFSYYEMLYMNAIDYLKNFALNIEGEKDWALFEMTIKAGGLVIINGIMGISLSLRGICKSLEEVCPVRELESGVK